MPWSTIILLAIHLGAKEVLQLFPTLPDWLKTILQELAGQQTAAEKLPATEKAQALSDAHKTAIRDAFSIQSKIGNPPDLVGLG